MADNKNAPIGVFDSGLGGLTSVKALKKLLPREDIVYFGDTARVPYGNRSKETLLEYARQDIEFLLTKNVKAILIACNTADSMTRTEMEQIFDIPIVGVVQSAAKLASSFTKNGRIGVIGTNATVSTGVYKKFILGYNPSAEVFSSPTPLLVPLIEDGRIKKTDRITVDLLNEYLLPFKEQDIDTLVLGCTHYPMLMDIISDILPGVELIDTGCAAVKQLSETLAALDLFTDRECDGTPSFFVSDAPESFALHGSMFIGDDITQKVRKISL